MSEIPLDKFITLCENVQSTHTTVKKMDVKVDSHTLQLRDLENHNKNTKLIREALATDRAKRFKTIKLWLGIPSVIATILAVAAGCA